VCLISCGSGSLPPPPLLLTLLLLLLLRPGSIDVRYV
jgi:uncharacterized protein (TIGR03382 family)